MAGVGGNYAASGQNPLGTSSVGGSATPAVGSKSKVPQPTPTERASQANAARQAGKAKQSSLNELWETREEKPQEEKWQNWPVSIPEFPVDAKGMIQAPFEKILAETVAGNRVTYLGENHGVPEIRHLLRASIGELKNAGVNTLFVECIHQEDNAVLEKFMEDGDRGAFVAALGENSGKIPGYIPIIEAFRQQGIKVVGMDVRASLDSKSNVEERNVAWATKINEVFASHPGCKALVWGGSQHFAQKGCKKSVSSLLPGPVITFVGDRHEDIHSPGGAAYCSTKIVGDIVVNPLTYRNQVQLSQRSLQSLRDLPPLRDFAAPKNAADRHTRRIALLKKNRSSGDENSMG